MTERDLVGRIADYRQDPWSLMTQILEHATSPILAYGPPARGKTYAATHLGLDGRAVHTADLTDDSTKEDLMGQWVPCGPHWSWVDGPVTRAWRHGDRVVLNEITLARRDARDALITALESRASARYTLPRPLIVDPETGETRPAQTEADLALVDWRAPMLETITPHPRTQTVCTDNTDDPDEDLHPRLASRLSIRVRVDQPNPAAIEALPEDLRALARSGSNRAPDLRALTAIADLRAAGLDDAATLLAVTGARAEDTATTLRLALAPEDAPPLPNPPDVAHDHVARADEPVVAFPVTCAQCGETIADDYSEIDSDGDAHCSECARYQRARCSTCGDHLSTYDDENDNRWLGCRRCETSIDDLI